MLSDSSQDLRELQFLEKKKLGKEEQSDKKDKSDRYQDKDLTGEEERKRGIVSFDVYKDYYR